MVNRNIIYVWWIFHIYTVRKFFLAGLPTWAMSPLSRKILIFFALLTVDFFANSSGKSTSHMHQVWVKTSMGLGDEHPWMMWKHVKTIGYPGSEKTASGEGNYRVKFHVLIFKPFETTAVWAMLGLMYRLIKHLLSMARHTQDLENEAKYGYTKFVAGWELAAGITERTQRRTGQVGLSSPKNRGICNHTPETETKPWCGIGMYWIYCDLVSLGNMI